MKSNSRLMDWGQLVRVPNTFTVLADVGAAFLLAAGGPQPVLRFVVILLAGVCFYWAGMVLNDVWDIDKDRRERPRRPLPAGRISLQSAKLAGWGLLLAGVALAGTSGYLPSEGVENTWRPLVIGVALAVMIVAYDGPLKQTPAAPPAMGMCRVLSFLLGASPVLTGGLPERMFEPHVLGLAAGFGVYIMGVTQMARREAGPSQSALLPLGLIIAMLGAALIAVAPRYAPPGTGYAPPGTVWAVLPDGRFALLIGLIAFAVLFRGVRAVISPQPRNVQMLIRVAILTIIPLSAAVALLGAGPAWGMIIFLLVIPAIVLSARFRVT